MHKAYWNNRREEFLHENITGFPWFSSAEKYIKVDSSKLSYQKQATVV